MSTARGRMEVRRRRTLPPPDMVAVGKLNATEMPAPTETPALRSDVTGLDPFSIASHPTKYHQSYAKIVLRVMSKGGSLFSVAREVGCSTGTIRAWAERWPEFRAALEVGQDMARGWWEDVGRANLLKRDFNAILWMMNMSNKFGWNRVGASDAGQEPTIHLHDHKHLSIDPKKLPTEKLKQLREFVEAETDKKEKEDEAAVPA